MYSTIQIVSDMLAVAGLIFVIGIISSCYCSAIGEDGLERVILKITSLTIILVSIGFILKNM